LQELLTIPTISTDPSHYEDMQRGARWIAQALRDLGSQAVELYPSPATHPIVYGELSQAGPDAPTVLVYGHYDVQPAEPMEAWSSDPFDPQVRGENLYARGATDMKGQILATINAIEAISATGQLPVNLKFLIEGEEEIGSSHLEEFIATHQLLLKCDVGLNPDTGMLAPDLPTITYALRGLTYFELRVYGPEQDLHSGTFGGVVHNPAQALCELLAGMHDQHGRVTLPGFYDSVRQLDQEERKELARLPLEDAFYLAQTGAPALWGEEDFTPVERATARPTLEINGLYSGFTGEGSKTVLPAYAMAKISTRLVPEQTPGQVEGQIRRYLEKHAPPTIRWELIPLSHGPASISDRNSHAIQAISKALETVWGRKPMFRREGGTVPVVAHFQEHLGIESVNTGFSLPDDHMHGPDEKINLTTWSKGTQALIHFFFNMAD
jgi:acetylornithine deacetylase/succinyl-diaminopimelate desuccinylase-like protein